MMNGLNSPDFRIPPYVSNQNSESLRQSLPGKDDEAYVNQWVHMKQHDKHGLNLLQFEENDGPLAYQNGENSVNQVCLEDHRLLIDQAIDRLKGELYQKERDVIQPLVYRQKTIIEEHTRNRKRLEQKVEDLERMVMMQEQTIRVLLNINQEVPLNALSIKNSLNGSHCTDPSRFASAKTSGNVVTKNNSLSKFQDNMQKINQSARPIVINTIKFEGSHDTNYCEQLHATHGSIESLSRQNAGQVLQKPLHISKEHVRKVLNPSYKEKPMQKKSLDKALGRNRTEKMMKQNVKFEQSGVLGRDSINKRTMTQISIKSNSLQSSFFNDIEDRGEVYDERISSFNDQGRPQSGKDNGQPVQAQNAPVRNDDVVSMMSKYASSNRMGRLPSNKNTSIPAKKTNLASFLANQQNSRMNKLENLNRKSFAQTQNIPLQEIKQSQMVFSSRLNLQNKQETSGISDNESIISKVSNFFSNTMNFSKSQLPREPKQASKS